MILLDLLGVLIVGVSFFLLSHIVDLFRPKRKHVVHRIPPRLPEKRQRRQIKADLDNLLVRYNQGILNEQQYYYEANELIDQLADVLETEASFSH
ncbi:hypothetical protein L0663_00760 [Dyadobacter sp. CY107]|uniref:hypothetical protein n=1 Tax=Dyadobacter fanqingshengii TaxID=2906443 RepID=UPI001F3A494E|nr:hypothetical protein [Dyadobacter fanqingshengii]MCF2501892.1 hypothetical protein [Dyadobacter fanqingshengii]